MDVNSFDSIQNVDQVEKSRMVDVNWEKSSGRQLHFSQSRSTSTKVQSGRSRPEENAMVDVDQLEKCSMVEKCTLVDSQRRRVPFFGRQQAALFITPFKILLKWKDNKDSSCLIYDVTSLLMFKKKAEAPVLEVKKSLIKIPDI